jgi:4-oxalocrotonate tautomerase
MGGEISRRNFLKKSVIALGAVAACDFNTLGAAEQASGLKALSSEKLKEETMPHVIVKLWPGKSEQQKIQLAEAIVKDVVNIMNLGEESVSVAIEEIPAADWKKKVYEPDILDNRNNLYKKPGYSM